MMNIRDIRYRVKDYKIGSINKKCVIIELLENKGMICNEKCEYKWMCSRIIDYRNVIR